MIPWSRLSPRARIGLRYFAEVSVLRTELPAPQGIVDDVSALAGPGVDAARVHPAVRAFFERTASQTLHIESRWAWWSRWIWRLARRWFVHVGQLTTPLRETVMRTEMVALDDAREGRPGARGVLRTHADGAPMQVVAYAVVPGPLLSVAFPTPFGVLTGLLRMDVITDEDGALAVTLTSTRANGDAAGVYVQRFGRAWRVPLGERMSLWPASMRARPTDLDPAKHPGAALVGAHVQTLFGLAMVRHRYWFVPNAPGETAVLRSAG